MIRISVSLLCCLYISLRILSQSLPDNIDIKGSSNGVINMPTTVPAIFHNIRFLKYTKIACHNGEAIQILALNQISEAQIVRARKMLEFYLQYLPGTQFGLDDRSNEPSVEGHVLYHTNNYTEHHHASVEEILHLMHDLGIGIDGINTINNPTLPDRNRKYGVALNKTSTQGTFLKTKVDVYELRCSTVPIN
jgi:hypothetical protein